MQIHLFLERSLGDNRYVGGIYSEWVFVAGLLKGAETLLYLPLTNEQRPSQAIPCT